MTEDTTASSLNGKRIAKSTVLNEPLSEGSQNEQGRSKKGLELPQHKVGEETEKYCSDTELLRFELVWPCEILVRGNF